MPKQFTKSWPLWTLLRTHPLFRDNLKFWCIHTWRQREKTLDLSLPPHASTKTRRLRAVTAFLFLHSWIHIASVEMARTWQGSIHTWRQWEKTLHLSLPPHALTKTRRLRAVITFLFLHSCWVHIASVEMAQGTSASHFLAYAQLWQVCFT